MRLWAEPRAHGERKGNAIQTYPPLATRDITFSSGFRDGSLRLAPVPTPGLQYVGRASISDAATAPIRQTNLEEIYHEGPVATL